MKCIIFVNRIITAISLSYILQNLKFLASWKCHFLIGVHAGLKSMSRKTMNVILEKFQSGELNLLVATKVGEEGLDIQTCCLVVRFDLPETVASFIQSRGRARMPQSEYAFLVDSGNEKEINLIENFKRDEDRMNVEIVSRTSDGIFARFDERIYKVDSTGASISPGYSISLLHHYCSRLPHDEYFDPKPKFYFFDDLDGTVCHIVLPSNAPIRRIVSTPQASIEAAKKDACLTAVEQLHKLGVLNDYLLPEENDADKEETILNSFDPDSSEEEELRGELYEMIVPAVLKGPWSMSDGHVNLSCYYIKFIPDPDDRIYRKFGLFLKAPLPVEAEEMELDLHLARRRSVMTRLIRAGFTEFSKDEITQAQNFQQMFFKVILDRSELIAEFVPSERNFFSESSSPTFYLLLPVILSECESTVHVDWQIVRRCLSSPMFKTPADPMEQEVHPSGLHLQLANGCWSITDVENSLVYAPHKKQFFFTTHVVHDRNAYGPFKESSTSSHMEHLFKTFSIRLKYPEQPLLQAKPLFGLRNLLHNRKPEDTESQELEEFFIYVPPELFQLKIIGFSKDIGSSLSLLPSIMHRLENLLVAIELKHLLSASFPEGAEVTALRVLEALTTEKCQERFSLERLELLGDAFLKFAVGRHLFLLHDTLDEGELTRKRSNAVNNSNLFKLATRSNIQVYIRDQLFEPCHFFAWGRPCPVICNEETEGAIHSPCRHSAAAKPNPSAVRCSKGHLWLCKKTIADVVEALVGAFIVDSGFKAATAFLRWIGIRVDFEASQVIKACSASKIYMPLAASMDVTALESLLGYQFHHKGLLLQAFVHPSYSKHGGGCYQRLEFLGDAVLDYLITSYLFSVYPKLKPGQLTDLRSVSVNNKAFADVAVNQSFHKFLFCDSSSLSVAIEKYAEFVSGPASESNHFEGPKCPKVLGDLVESCLGAILLDSGFNLNCVWKIMLSFLDPIRSFSSLQLNPVRELQELCQSHDWDLQFSASKKGGIFFVEAKVTMTDDSVAFSASSASKKDATKIASQLTFAKLKGQGYVPKTKSLKEVLMSSVKMEAKLIGYDETPTDVMASIAPEFENLKLEGPFGRDINPNGGLISEPTITRPSCIIPIGKLPSSSSGVGRGPSSETTADPSSETHIQTTGGLHKGSAKSRLSEVCVANCWKAPVYECCEEEGPSHLKLFTYKVILEIDEAPDTTVECFGEPKTKKKVAAEHAAEGALWYLEHQGYLH